MPKLNQIVAVEKGLKSRTTAAVTEIYHDLQKSQLFAGLSRVYTPRDDEGERLPAERTLVQKSVERQLDDAAAALAKLFDVVFTKDVANTQARGTVVVDDEELFEAPVPFLLFVEKQLIDLCTMLKKLPTLDPSEVWLADQSVGGYRTEPTETTRTRKVPEVLVKYPATDKHPAQVETFMRDEIVGRWATTKFSGAVSQQRKDELIGRVNVLADAVKQAVEQANAMEVDQLQVGQEIFDFILSR